MSCKSLSLSLSTFSITCLLLIWMTVAVRPVFSARKLDAIPVRGEPDKGKVSGNDSPRGPGAAVGPGGGGPAPSFPSPDQSSSPLDQSSSSSTNSDYSDNCTSERSCESLPNGEVSCTTVSNCDDSSSSQQQCISETCYSTIP